MSKAIAVRVTKFVLGVMLLVPAVGAAYISILAMPSVWGFAGLAASALVGIGFAGTILVEAIKGKDFASLSNVPQEQAYDWTNTSWDWSRRADCLTNPASPFFQGQR
jgi:hypothetical protein